MIALNRRFRPSTWQGIGTQALIFGGAGVVLIILAGIVGVKGGRIEIATMFFSASVAAIVFAIKEQRNLALSRIMSTINTGKRDTKKPPMELHGG